MDEIRQALRRLRARPVATLASIVTLGCAIAASATAWSIVSGVMLRPVPARDAGRLVVLGYPQQFGPAAGSVYDGVIYPTLPAVRDSGIFQQVSGQWATPLKLTVDAGAGLARLEVGFIDRELPSLLGVPIRLGRAFTAGDDRQGAAPVALLSDRYWRDSLGGNSAVIGRTIRVGGKPVVVVGVLGHRFLGTHLANSFDVFLPLRQIAAFGSPYNNYFADPNHDSSPWAGLTVIGRLRPGQSRSEVLQRLRALPAIGARRDRLAFLSLETAALPVAARGSMKEFTTLLGATVGCLLLVGCSAVGILLLTRTEARRPELATCLALGASRARLAAGIVWEGIILSAAGTAVAIPTASWLMHALTAFQLPGGIDISRLNLSMDARAVFSAAGAAVVAMLLISGTAVGVGLTAKLADTLRSRGGTTPALKGMRRSLLVTAQVALAVVLTIGTGLFARSLIASQRLNSGIEADRVVTAYVSRDTGGRPSPDDPSFFARLEQRLSIDPAFASVAYTVSRGSMQGSLTIDGISRPLPSQVSFDAIDTNYLRTLGVRVIEGRGFMPAEADATNVAIISSSFARFIGTGRSALGHRVMLPWREMDKPAAVVTVVGVVPDIVLDVSALQPLAVYLPLPASAPDPARTITVRVASTSEAGKRAIAAAVKETDPAIVPLEMSTISESIAEQMAPQQFGIVIVGGLAILAVLLTAVTAYVLADALVGLRRREMGIRAALGATRSRIAGIVLYENARLVLSGVFCGFAVVWLASRAIRSLLFEVQPLDGATLAIAGSAVAIVAGLVSLRPALRAASVDIAQDLRHE
jgi:putative ABC transport system permease protein